jgi:hypothetical protein
MNKIEFPRRLYPAKERIDNGNFGKYRAKAWFKALCDKMLWLMESSGTYLDLKAGGTYNLARLK